MKLKISFVCLLFLAAIISCKKDEPVVDGKITESNPALLLSKVMTDNQPSFEYSYNAAKLVSVEKSQYNFTLNHYNEKNQLISTDYFSNYDILSSDLQIFQTALNKKEWVTPDSPNKGGTIRYEYSSDDRLSKATYTPTSGTAQSSEFSYDGNGRISKQILFWEDTQTGYIDYSYDGKGNLIKEVLYNLSSSGNAELSTTTDYEFDNQQNPYKFVSRLMTPGINSNQNNIIKETYTINMQAVQATDTVEITDNSYEYNSQGYPVSKNGNITYIYG